MPTRICQHCGKEFEDKSSKQNRKFCSIECMGLAFRGRKMNKITRSYITKESEREEKSLPPELTEQLRLLKTFKENKLISEAEYQKRKEKLLSQNN